MNQLEFESGEFDFALCHGDYCCPYKRRIGI